MSGPVETRDLECPCERKTKRFSRLFKLRYHPNTGMREEGVAWKCDACGEEVSVQAMVQHDFLRRKEAEIAELRAEVDQASQ